MSSGRLGTRLGMYLWERFNPVLMCVICLIFGLGSLPVWNTHHLLLTGLAMYLYLLQLRITDEYKDFDHDRKFYPLRPVSRGLVSLPELGRLLVLVIILELILVSKQGSFFWFLILESYAFVMSHEFWAKQWMKNHFSSNILLHELSVIPLFIYLFSFNQRIVLSPQVLLTAVFLGLNFFLLEIGRKIRPKYELVGDDTYLEQYGFTGTVLLSGAVITIAVVIAVSLFFPPGWLVIIWGVLYLLVLGLVILPDGHPLGVSGLKILLVLAVLFMVVGKAYVYF